MFGSVGFGKGGTIGFGNVGNGGKGGNVDFGNVVNQGKGGSVDFVNTSNEGGNKGKGCSADFGTIGNGGKDGNASFGNGGNVGKGGNASFGNGSRGGSVSLGNVGMIDKILEPKIVRKILRSLPKRFHVKITAIEESKDLDSIPLIELIGNLQTNELALARVGKGSQGKTMTLKVKNDDNDELSKDEDTKLKSYITRQFKKFIKNAYVKASDKDHKQFAFSQFKSQDKGKREFKDASQGNSVLAGPKCYE
nr:glycine, alanine and asparagine-rich protein-like [Quercus suber]